MCLIVKQRQLEPFRCHISFEKCQKIKNSHTVLTQTCTRQVVDTVRFCQTDQDLKVFLLLVKFILDKQRNKDSRSSGRVHDTRNVCSSKGNAREGQEPLPSVLE